jgi:hypothetical protein
MAGFCIGRKYELSYTREFDEVRIKIPHGSQTAGPLVLMVADFEKWFKRSWAAQNIIRNFCSAQPLKSSMKNLLLAFLTIASFAGCSKNNDTPAPTPASGNLFLGHWEAQTLPLGYVGPTSASWVQLDGITFGCLLYSE